MTKIQVGRILGICVQGVVVGLLLLVAVVELASSEIGAKLFRYQGF